MQSVGKEPEFWRRGAVNKDLGYGERLVAGADGAGVWEAQTRKSLGKEKGKEEEEVVIKPGKTDFPKLLGKPEGWDRKSWVSWLRKDGDGQAEWSTERGWWEDNKLEGEEE